MSKLPVMEQVHQDEWKIYDTIPQSSARRHSSKSSNQLNCYVKQNYRTMTTSTQFCTKCSLSVLSRPHGFIYCISIWPHKMHK